MAHPALIVDQAVRQFLNQWHFGLKPTLCLKAKPNGSIAIDLSIIACLPMTQTEELRGRKSKRCSGRSSRRRRRKRRSDKMPAQVLENSSSLQDVVDETCNHQRDIPQSSKDTACLPVINDSPATNLNIEYHPTTAEKSVPETLSEIINDANPREQQPPDVPTVQCEMCNSKYNKVRLFSTRSDFLKHLSIHYRKELLQVYPFTEGMNCRICLETLQQYTPSKKEVFACHLGVVHSKIFELLPNETLQEVMKLPT